MSSKTHFSFPESVHFTCELTVRVSDLNYGNHLSNDAVLRLAHEARLQMLLQHNMSEQNLGNGSGLIVRDAAIFYRTQAFYGDVLNIDMSLSNFSRCGCDIYYRFIRSKNSCEIALCKTGIVAFNYSTQKITTLPKDFHIKWN